MAKTQVVAELILENAKLTKALNDSQRKMNAFKKKVTTGNKGISASFAKIGPAIAAAYAVTKVIGGMKKLADAADLQIRVEQKVITAIQSTGMAAGLTSEQLFDMASGLQKVTRFGDEEILGGVTAQLLTFTNVADEQFGRAQKSILNIATVLDTDLKSVALQVGKALNAPVQNLSALSRAGIQFTQDQKDVVKALWEAGDAAGAQSVILAELEKQYGGQAEAMAKIGMGPWKQMSNLMGDIKEEIGAALIPMFTKLANWFVDTWPMIKAFFQNARNAVIGLVNEFIELYNESTAFKVVIQYIRTYVKSLFDAWKTFFKMTIQGFVTMKELFMAVFDRDVKVADVLKGYFEGVKEMSLELGVSIKENIEEGIANVKSPKVVVPIEYVNNSATSKQMPTPDPTQMAADASTLVSQANIPGGGAGAAPSVLPDTIQGMVPSAGGGTGDFDDWLANMGDSISGWVSDNGELLGTLFDTAMYAADLFSAHFEKNKQKELAAAGNNAKKKEEIERKYAKKQKRIAIVQAIIATALGIAKAIPNIPMMILAAVTGAASIATISAQSYAMGGIVPGSSFSGDKVPAMVNSGELILNGGQQANLFKMLNRAPAAQTAGQVVFRIGNDELVGTLQNYNMTQTIME